MSLIMNDAKTTLLDIKERVEVFVREREWNQFHSPKNVSMAIAVEASELQELFLWSSTQESFLVAQDKKKEVEDELADVLIALVAFANATQTDIAQVFERKLAETAQKYPVEKVKGKSDKYTAY